MAKKKSRNVLTYDTLPALFTGICDAIRAKTGGTELINHQDIPEVISQIGSSGQKVIYSHQTNAEPYHAANYNFIPLTISDTGTCKVWISTSGINFAGNEGVLRKNGDTVSKSIDSSPSSSASVIYYEFEAVSGDVLTFTKGSSTNANTTLMIIVSIE